MIYKFDNQEEMKNWLVLYTKKCAQLNISLPKMKIEWIINRITI